MSNLAFKGIKAVLDGYMGRNRAAETGADAEQVSHQVSHYECIPETLVVSIDKRLPVAAGIAGGSGNGAACMLGLNALMGYPFSLRELMELGVRVGADVPFSLMMNARRNAGMLAGMAGLEEASAAAWVSGIGDIVEPASPISRHVIMANPGISVSTKDAYTAIDSLKSYSGKSSKRLFINDLESYTLAGYPEAAELKRIMTEELEADTVLMSGSGPTMIAYYSEQDKVASDFSRLEKICKNHNGWRLWFTQTGCTL